MIVLCVGLGYLLQRYMNVVLYKQRYKPQHKRNEKQTARAKGEILLWIFPCEL